MEGLEGLGFGAEDWRGTGAATGQASGSQGEPSFLQLLQQQASAAQQPQQHLQQPPHGSQSFTAMLQQPARPPLGQQQYDAGMAHPGQYPFAPEAMYGSWMPPGALQQQHQGIGGGSELPAAILRHQQAALERHQQATTTPGTSTGSDPSTGGLPVVTSPQGLPALQPWMLPPQQAQQQGLLPGMAVPLAPLVPVGSAAQQPYGADSAHAYDSAAGGTDAGGPPPQRRRGRQPKDAALLTEKQLRAREAQKRFRDKQKRAMAETEAAVAQTGAELDRMRIGNESQRLKNEVLERLLQHKEAQVHALELQKQMDPPPRFVISPEMVDMMRREGIAGLFTPEVLLRYAVAGYTEHMDERGEVKDPPPFEKVAEDWAEIVELVQSILNAARQAGGPSGGAPASAAAKHAAPARPSREARPAEVVELQSAPAGSASGRSSPDFQDSIEEVPVTSSGVSSGGSLGRRSPHRVPEHVKPEFVAIAEEAPDEVLEVAQAKDDPLARFVLARILSQTAAHSHLQWDTLVEGAAVEHGPFLYRFTGQQLRALAALMRRTGLMLWQQALLFPSHITKLGTLRLDDPGNPAVGQQDLGHWRSILRRLHCRPEQLHKIAAGHRRYVERLAPVMRERAEAVAEVQRCTRHQLEHMLQEGTQDFVRSTMRLTEATGLVMQTVSAQHAAYCELLIAVFYALTFPVQRPMLLVLSWPYFPQLELIGKAASLEVGAEGGEGADLAAGASAPALADPPTPPAAAALGHGA